MARLLTNGAETQKVASTAIRDPENQNCFVASGAVNIATSNQRSGAACFAPNLAGGWLEMDFTGVTARDYWQRVAFRMPAASPTSATPFMTFMAGQGVPVTGVQLNTDGTMQMFDNAVSPIGSKSAVLTAVTYYVVEMHAIMNTNGTGTLGFRINGTTVQADMSSSLLTGLMTGVAIGKIGGSDTTTALRLDDWALNDDQGVFQVSWPGGGKIVILRPTSDNARAGFTGGAGGTTNLFAAEDNAPPVGVVNASATDASQIHSSVNNSTDHYDANLAAYTTAVASGGGGMAATDLPVLAYSLARGGNSTTTSRTLAVECLSNPAVAEITVASGSIAAGTDNNAAPVGWISLGRIIYLAGSGSSTTVTPGTQPVLKVRKGTASTDAMNYDLMGLMVEYQPVTTQAVDDTASLADSVGKGATKANADTATPSDAIVKASGLHPAEAPALADAIVKASGKAVAETPSVADAFVKASGKGVADTATLSDAVQDAIALALSAAVALADATASTSGFVRSVDDSVTPSDASTRAAGAGISESIAVAEALTKGFGLKSQDALSLADALVTARGYGLALADSLSLADAVRDAVALALADVLGLADAASTVSPFLISLADPVVLADALSRAMRLPRADAVALADAVSKAPGLRPVDSVSLADALVASRGLGLSLTDTLMLADAVRDTIAVILSDAVATADADVAAAGFHRTLTDVATLADAVAKAMGLPRADALVLVELVVKSIGVNEAEGLTLADDFDLERWIGRTVGRAAGARTGTANVVGPRAGSVTKPRTGA